MEHSANVLLWLYGPVDQHAYATVLLEKSGKVQFCKPTK